MTNPPPRRLLLFSSSFPFGRGETFLAAEFPYLEEVFDEIIVLSNDVSSPQSWPVGPKVRCERASYGLTAFEKLRALRGIFDPTLWLELRRSRRRSPEIPVTRLFATVLSSWAKARRFANRAAAIAAERPASKLCVYSYWANDMALAAALARARGVVHRAVTRAHGWDVYSSRPEVGLLPFRDHLAHHLDAILFVSEDGRDFFSSTVKGGLAIREVVRLGTPQRAEGPQGRGEEFTIVSCSALIPLKRIALLARALVSSEVRVRWTHVGDGPERAEIERICSSAAPNVKVELTGQLSPDGVIETWRRLKPAALVNVSSSEGIPVSMMEAMSLGIPVIGTRVGGVPEIVAHGVNGHLLSGNPTPDEIATTIRLFANMSDGTFDALSAGAWRTWSQKYRAETNFRRLVPWLDPRERPVWSA